MQFSKSTSTTTTKNSSPDKETVSLFIYLGSADWRAYAYKQNGTSLKLPNAGEVAFLNNTQEFRTEQMLRTIVGGISSALRKQLTHCYLLWDSNDLTFVDTKIEILRAASVARLRELGREWINCKDVSFGYSNFSITNQEGYSSAVYAFVDTTWLRKILVGMGDAAHLATAIAPKIREIIPTEFLILKAAEASPHESYSAIMVGIEYTKIICAHLGIGAVTVRHIPVGIATLVTAVANQTGTRPEEVLSVLKERDYISILAAERETATLSPQEQALMPLLHKLNNEISATLDYFRSQRACGLPQKIVIYGETKRIRGLDTWIISGLPANIHGEIKGGLEVLFDTFIKRPFPMTLNLLKGAEGALVSVGKIKLSFSEKEGMIPYQNITKQIGSTTRARARTRNAQREVGFFTKLTGMFGKHDTGKGTMSDDIESETIYFILFYAFIILILYLGYEQYSKFDRVFQSTARTYDMNFSQNKELRDKIRGKELITVSTGMENKVLWTEKFLAIGNHITENLWLTDVYLDGATHSTGKMTLSSARLIMKGAALPRSEGHVGVIGDFVDALTKDEPMFMSDFRNVSFSGFTTDTTDAEPVVRFVLEAHYDPTKRLAITTSNDSANPISSLQNTVDKRNLSIEKATGIKSH